MSEETTYEMELVNCPDCGEPTDAERNFSTHGDGYATRETWCTSCDWEGTEEWMIHQTIEYSEDED